MTKFRQVVFMVMLSLFFLIPFLTMNDFFPFMRWGMFAEMPNRSLRIEKMDVYYVQNGQSFCLNPLDIDVSTHVWGYILRKFYYKKQQQELLKEVNRLWALKEKPKVEKWLFTSEFTAQDSVSKDTTFLLMP